MQVLYKCICTDALRWSSPLNTSALFKTLAELNTVHTTVYMATFFSPSELLSNSPAHNKQQQKTLNLTDLTHSALYLDFISYDK